MRAVRVYDAGMWTYVLVDVGPEGPATIEILGADGGVLDRVAVPDPRLRSVAGPQGGGETATLPHATARVRIVWPPGAASVRGGRLAPGGPRRGRSRS